MREWSKLRTVGRSKQRRATVLNERHIHLVLVQAVDQVLVERVAVHAVHAVHTVHVVHVVDAVHVHRIHADAVHVVDVARCVRGSRCRCGCRQNRWHWQPVRGLG